MVTLADIDEKLKNLKDKQIFNASIGRTFTRSQMEGMLKEARGLIIMMKIDPDNITLLQALGLAVLLKGLE